MRERNIVLWYVVSILTFGIALIVWYYLLNKDANARAQQEVVTGAERRRDHDRFDSRHPGLRLELADVEPRPRATDADGLSAGLQFCLVFIPVVNLAFWGYLQSKLNRSVAVSGVATAASVA